VLLQGTNDLKVQTLIAVHINCKFYSKICLLDLLPFIVCILESPLPS